MANSEMATPTAAGQASDGSCSRRATATTPGSDTMMARNHTTRERIWKVRRNIAEAFKAICPVQSLEDIVVPLAQIPALVARLEELSAQYDVLIPCYGHAGDGNLHATPVKKPETPLDEWEEKLPALLKDLYGEVYRLGGTISGEHGLGLAKRDELSLEQSAQLIALQRRLKSVFDPKGIMNPGKLCF